MTDTHPILTVYDKEGRYASLLPLAEESGFTVIDTTEQPMTAYERMADAWQKLTDDKTTKVLIYRKRPAPKDEAEKRDEPYQSYAQTGVIFPVGANDSFVNICQRFLPAKAAEIDRLFKQGTLDFDNVNNLQEGASYPSLETLTGGHSLQEIVLGILKKDSVTSLNWLSEWRRLVNTHFPGMKSDGTPTLQEVQDRMWQYLLFSEFVLDLPSELPDSLKSVPCANNQQQTSIYDINRRIRNSVDMRDYYVEAVEKVARDLDLERLFESASDLGEIVTFAFENRVEYDRFVNLIEVRDIDQAANLCSKNLKGIWYSADKECAYFWDIANAAVNLFQSIDKGVKPCEHRNELLEWYAQDGYKSDMAIRKFLTLYKQTIYRLPQLERLSDLVENAYRNFSERVVRTFQDFTKGDGFTVPESFAQNIDSFDTLIAPDLKNKKRVVMVMADAMRYEMGVDFHKTIASRFPKAECIPSLAYIPTVTRFGMAALLPGAKESLELKPIDGKLQPYIKGKLTALPEDRVNRIREALGNNVKVYDTLLEGFKSSDVGDDVDLLIIRSVKIDSACENCDSQGLGTMDLEVKQLVKAIENVRSIGFDEAYIFADHGYMLQPSFRTGDKVEKPVGNDIVLTERRCIAGNLNESEWTVQFTPEQAGINSTFPKIAFAKGFGVFEAGKTYFHEGLSLQENIVPIVHIVLSKEKKAKKQASYKLSYRGKTTGVVRILRPMIEVEASTGELFGDSVRVKMEVRNAAGAIAGSPIESDYYNETTEILSLPPSEVIKQPIELQDGLIGDIVVNLLDPETNMTLATILLQTDLN